MIFAEQCLVSMLKLTSEYSPNQRDRVLAIVPPPWCLVPGAYFQIFFNSGPGCGKAGPDRIHVRTLEPQITCARLLSPLSPQRRPRGVLQHTIVQLARAPLMRVPRPLQKAALGRHARGGSSRALGARAYSLIKQRAVQVERPRRQRLPGTALGRACLGQRRRCAGAPGAAPRGRDRVICECAWQRSGSGVANCHCVITQARNVVALAERRRQRGRTHRPEAAAAAAAEVSCADVAIRHARMVATAPLCTPSLDGEAVNISMGPGPDCTKKKRSFC
jgi:hypothetical protein